MLNPSNRKWLPPQMPLQLSSTSKFHNFYVPALNVNKTTFSLNNDYKNCIYSNHVKIDSNAFLSWKRIVSNQTTFLSSYASLYCPWYGPKRIWKNRVFEMFEIGLSNYTCAHTIWSLWVGTYDVIHMIWSIWYDPYDMIHMIWSIWHGPYDMVHMIWFIWFPVYDMVHIKGTPSLSFFFSRWPTSLWFKMQVLGNLLWCKKKIFKNRPLSLVDKRLKIRVYGVKNFFSQIDWNVVKKYLKRLETFLTDSESV